MTDISDTSGSERVRMKSVKTLMSWIARNGATALARIVATTSLIAKIVVNLGRVRRARAILLMPDGGFGHTLSEPDWLRRLHPGGSNLVFFAAIHDGTRHNPLVASLWGEEWFIWTRKGIALPVLGAIYDPRFLDGLYRGAQRFLKWYVPATPTYFSVEDLETASPQPAWLAPDSAFNSRYERRYYPARHAQPAPPLRVGEPVRSLVLQRLRDRFGSDFPRRCSFYLRYQATGNDTDTSSLNRLSAPLDAYLPAIGILNRAGYQVLLTGDVVVPPRIVAACEGGLVDARAAGVDRDRFSLFAGTEVDLHIGSLSGGSAFVMVTDIPALMLNAFAPGDALPRTTVHYKWLYENNGTVASLADLLGGRFYDHQLHGCDLVDNTAEEMAEAVADFIAHLDKRPYGIDPAEIGIKADWIRAADARLSPVWLRRYRERSQARHIRQIAAQ